MIRIKSDQGSWWPQPSLFAKLESADFFLCGRLRSTPTPAVDLSQPNQWFPLNHEVGWILSLLFVIIFSYSVLLLFIQYVLHINALIFCLFVGQISHVIGLNCQKQESTHTFDSQAFYGFESTLSLLLFNYSLLTSNILHTQRRETKCDFVKTTLKIFP